MLGRASSRIALSVLGVGALGAGTVAMTGTGPGAPRCAAYSYPTMEACQLRHSATVCRQNPQTTLWHPDRCGSSSTSGSSGSGRTYGSTGSGWWWWGGGGRDTTTTRSPTLSRPPTVVGRSPSSTGGSTTTSSPGSTSSRGGFGSTGSSRSSGG